MAGASGDLQPTTGQGHPLASLFTGRDTIGGCQRPPLLGSRPSEWRRSAIDGTRALASSAVSQAGPPVAPRGRPRATRRRLGSRRVADLQSSHAEERDRYRAERVARRVGNRRAAQAGGLRDSLDARATSVFPARVSWFVDGLRHPTPWKSTAEATTAASWAIGRDRNASTSSSGLVARAEPGTSRCARYEW